MSIKISEQEFNMMLVSAVRKHPCLYNFTISEYTRKDLADQAWADVGKEVNEKVHICKLRWKNIRTVFVRKIKPGLTSKAYKPYYLGNMLEFLIPFLKTAPCTATMDEIDQIKIENSELQGQEDYDFLDNEFNEGLSNEDFSETESSQIDANELNPPEIGQIQPNGTECAKNDPIGIDSIKLVSRSNKRKMKPEESQDEDDSLEFCNRSQHKVDEFNPKKMFLLSLLPEMNQMSDTQTRKFKRKVLEIVDDILDEQET